MQIAVAHSQTPGTAWRWMRRPAPAAAAACSPASPTSAAAAPPPAAATGKKAGRCRLLHRPQARPVRARAGRRRAAVEPQLGLLRRKGEDARQVHIILPWPVIFRIDRTDFDIQSRLWPSLVINSARKSVAASHRAETAWHIFSAVHTSI